MERLFVPMALACAAPVAASPHPVDPAITAWAYPEGAQPAPAAGWDAARPLTVPGSAERRTQAQLHDLRIAADWFPGSHPAMPPPVGRAPVAACGYCHLPSGSGRVENAAVAGLPAAYIARQIAAFASSARASAVPGHVPSTLMATVSRALTPAQIDAAARYFAGLRFQSHTRIVETANVPATSASSFVLVARPQESSQPLGQRIIETPLSIEQFERRDPRTAYVAWVPVGSIRRGAVLAAKAGCDTCHGSHLKGGGIGPPLAGRSPTYLFRQLLAFQLGSRADAETAPMQTVSAGLTAADMIALSSYAAALKP